MASKGRKGNFFSDKDTKKKHSKGVGEKWGKGQTGRLKSGESGWSDESTRNERGGAERINDREKGGV